MPTQLRFNSGKPITRIWRLAIFRTFGNLLSHKGPQIRTLVEATGVSLRYSPLFGPGCNLTKKIFAKLKAMLRKAAVRSIPSLWNAIGRLIDTLPS